MALLWVLLTISCISAFHLTAQSFAVLSSIPARLRPSNGIPYGSYLQGPVQTVTCQQSGKSLFAVLQWPAPCALADRLRTEDSLGAKVALLAEELESAVPESTDILIIFLANETAAILAKHPGIVLRADFSEDTQAQPLWEITASADLYIREAVMSFSQSTARIGFRDADSEGTQMWINGRVFAGGSEDIQRALCASFSEPPAACSPLLCSPHCWPEMLSNGLCDLPCFTSDCQYDFSDCSHTSRDLRRRYYDNTETTSNSNSTASACTSTACAIGVSIAVIVFCFGG